jgi:hypothetical protein
MNTIFEILREGGITEELAKELPDSFFKKVYFLVKKGDTINLLKELGPLNKNSTLKIKKLIEINNPQKYYNKIKKELEEKKIKEKEIHLKEISARYKKSKNDIYLQFLKENNFQEWRDPIHGHSLIIPPIDEGNKYFESIKILMDKDTIKGTKLKEITATDMLKEAREQNLSLNDMLSQPLKEIEDIVSED